MTGCIRPDGSVTSAPDPTVAWYDWQTTSCVVTEATSADHEEACDTACRVNANPHYYEGKPYGRQCRIPDGLATAVVTTRTDVCTVPVGSVSSPLLASSGGPESTVVKIRPELSSIALTLGDEVVLFRPIEGSVALTGTSCSEGPCPVEMTMLQVTLIGPDGLTMAGESVSEVVLVNRSPAQGSIDSDGAMRFNNATVELTIAATVSGDRTTLRFVPANEPIGFLDTDNGMLTLSGAASGGVRYRNHELQATLHFSLGGEILALPPTADPGSRQVVDCIPSTGLGVAVLDGSASYDSDGQVVSWLWQLPDSGVAFGETTTVGLGVGPHPILLNVRDDDGLSHSAETWVEVIVSQPPTIELIPDSNVISVCTPEPQAVALTRPGIIDECSDVDVEVVGAIIAINDQSIEPIEVPENGSVTLPLGSFVVRWTATGEGGTAMVDQGGRVVVAATEACCDAEQVLLLGTPERDFLVSRPGPICAFGLEAADMIQGSPRSDFLAGGDDDDMLFANASDVVVGEGGDDTIVVRNPADHVRLFGGDGRDHINARNAASSEIFGNDGDDVLLGSDGDDVIMPGPGKDLVLAGRGDDTVVVYDVCELESKTILNGGPGHDTLVSPVDLNTLESMGIVVLGFESIVVDASQTFLSECVR